MKPQTTAGYSVVALSLLIIVLVACFGYYETSQSQITSLKEIPPLVLLSR